MNAQEIIATRVVPHIPPGAVVNLGIGIPTLVADHLPEHAAHLQTENGLLGVGPTPLPGEADPDLVHAGKKPVTARPGASFFASSDSFGMIRGGHVEVAVLGALQIDARGRIANWSVPGKPVLGVGGAMDLLVGAGTVVVATTHTAKDGSPKIVEECSYPLTAQRAVDVVVTELATFRVVDGGLVLVDLAEGVTLDEVRAQTAAPFRVGIPEAVDA
ncbi:3-oxoacid CoA-transferase subunit B [Pseudonocardia sp. KRD-184]|uniref:3-oxoacid CoA-transferase subunit B n=1 Tax=Pseudonocardia oceani TaxID=2792013 RepID=A0ABS6UEL1_9PSEU|nr:3-oxoacid CoA-transferase subunit B [Pseudonocardia oceani]MBW0093161.1 3-oxoacid CoA-transferase subunit B [Pseudonocardia oceani]MBW0098006.1 3-oxoacid CoA-transferase subunit B [Pseudonocardia oceani]MBW0112600.1 3-oxoacid CoA-transferase subunit B [Pseudonocardia oceani]MBW0125664.1 3-oxoacid CoA-transferase subunit B [Pseudonocardia oceani]MBW0130666.1 3-oxoacid CoA-transferase subunit B [Pseudonocardia oceani]